MTTTATTTTAIHKTGMKKNPTLTPAEVLRVYPDEMTLREARTKYFERTGFDDKTYTDTWITLPVGPFTMYLPNAGPRREAVKVHDIDHIVTGYGTTWNGELTISAYELGMGLGRYWFGTFIDAGGVALGLLLWPREIVAAYARGRTTKRSVYEMFARFDDADLDRHTVGDVRAAVAAADAAVPTARDAVAVGAWAVAGFLGHIGLPLAVLAGAIAAAVVALT